MEYTTPQEGIYLFGNEPYLIEKDEEGELKVYNHNGLIPASPYLFKNEEPITEDKIQNLLLDESIAQDYNKSLLLKKGIEILIKQSSQSLAKCTDVKDCSGMSILSTHPLYRARDVPPNYGQGFNPNSSVKPQFSIKKAKASHKPFYKH